MNTQTALVTGTLTDTRINSQAEKDIKDSLAVMVQTVFAAAGQVPDKSDVVLIIREISRDLRNRFKNLTLAEVKTAMDNGVRGCYGDYYGINVVTINKWLKAYTESDERVEAVKSRNTPALPPRTAPAAEGGLNMEAAVSAAFEKYRREGKVNDYGNVIYDYLNKQGFIKFTNRQKERMMREAREELAEDAHRRSKNIVNLKVLADGITCGRITARAKRIALNEYFALKLAGEIKNGKQ